MEVKQTRFMKFLMWRVLDGRERISQMCETNPMRPLALSNLKLNERLLSDLYGTEVPTC